MRKPSSRKRDEMRSEYDFASMSGGVRGKYARRLKSASNIVRLDPEVAKAFPNDEAVNEALRVVIRASKALRRS